MRLVDGHPLCAGGDHRLHPDHHHSIGIAAFRIAGFVLWPFGRHIGRRPEAGVASLIGNIIWIRWLVACDRSPGQRHHDVTIIGIPLGLANFKVIPISLFPLGVRIVPGRMLLSAVTGMAWCTRVGHGHMLPLKTL